MRSASSPVTRRFRPLAERMEARLVMSAATVAAEVRMVLNRTPGEPPVRPNTPVLPLESPASTASFIDPSARIIRGNRISIGQRDYVAPYVSFDARGGYIKIGSSSTVQDNATLVANPTRARGAVGIFIGDNVVVSAGATVIGPATIGATGGAAASIGANAVIDGAIVRGGAFVGALARVGPGVTINTGVRVLPGANVTTQAEAIDPALGKVVLVTSGDTSATTATMTIARTTALASGYTNLYQGISATGPGTSSGGPLPAPLATGTTTFFGALDNVTGVSPEPGSRFVAFEPTAGTPTFRAADGTNAALGQNIAFRFPARVIGQVVFGEPAGSVRAAIGRRNSIRGDEGQPITFLGSISGLGTGVTIHSPLGGVRTTTTTTVVTTTTTNTGVTNSVTTTSSIVSNAAPTATPGTTTATTTSVDPSTGTTTTGTTTTTIANSVSQVGTIEVGDDFRAGDKATILGGPSGRTIISTNVTIGSGAVIDTSIIGPNALIGDRAYIANSFIPLGAVVPAGTIVINNQPMGVIQY